MRLVLDVMGAPARSGGMQLYATELVRSWAEEFPDDDLHVVGGDWVSAEFATFRTVHPHPVPGTRFLTRAYHQLVGSGVLFRFLRADALVSVTAIVSPLAPRSRRICVIHDWRHLRRPDEFGTGQTLYRKLWRWSIRRAAAVVTISPKTDAETAQFVPGARRVLIPNGADHPRRWALDELPEPAERTIVTFGHHPNKRPELVIEALERLSAEAQDVRLVVLGAKGEHAAALQERARQLGVSARCSFPGFVEPDRYQRLVAEASVVVLVSTDEGFGLPVAEGRYFGIPVVVASDSGLEEIFGDEVHVSRPDPEALAAAISIELANGRGARRAVGQTWGDVVRAIRLLTHPGIS
jgi:glycosyltransferase involved in cell wall biosynthesis